MLIDHVVAVCVMFLVQAHLFLSAVISESTTWQLTTYSGYLTMNNYLGLHIFDLLFVFHTVVTSNFFYVINISYV